MVVALEPQITIAKNVVAPRANFRRQIALRGCAVIGSISRRGGVLARRGDEPLSLARYFL
jgi:hypothetical protein